MTAPDFGPEINADIQQAYARGLLDINTTRCKVCRNPAMLPLVNKMIALGDTLADIEATLEPINRLLPNQERISYDSIRRHRQSHFDVQSPAWAIHRKIVERKAEEQGKDFERGVGNMVDYITYLETMKYKGYETTINPETVIEPMQGLAAAKEQDRIRKDAEGQVDKAQMMAEIGHIITVVRQFVPKEQWKALQAALNGEEAPVPISSRREAPEEIQMVPIMNDHDESFDA